MRKSLLQQGITPWVRATAFAKQIRTEDIARCPNWCVALA